MFNNLSDALVGAVAFDSRPPVVLKFHFMRHVHHVRLLKPVNIDGTKVV